MSEKSVVGDLINFRGLVYSPINENGVIFLFGKVMDELNMYIEEIKPGFPDCIGRVFRGKGWEKISIEFEYKSSNFKEHKHNPSNCDVIVCWEHDWPDCPIEVITLKELINTLPNDAIKRPSDIKIEYSLEEKFVKAKAINSIKNMYVNLESQIKGINNDIWSKVAKTSISYYSPERAFVYTYIQKQSIRVEVFTNGENIDGVNRIASEGSTWGAKWGVIYLKHETDLAQVVNATKTAFKRIKQAIKNNEPTSWGVGYKTLQKNNN